MKGTDYKGSINWLVYFNSNNNNNNTNDDNNNNNNNASSVVAGPTGSMYCSNDMLLRVPAAIQNLHPCTSLLDSGATALQFGTVIKALHVNESALLRPEFTVQLFVPLE
jgi:hypothetical protein